MAASDTGEHRPVRSTLRTLEILEHLAQTSERQSLGHLSRTLGIPKSSLHAILRTMRDKGWIELDEASQRYGLGVRALLAGTAYVDSDDVASIAGDTLDWLVRETGETVHLGRLDGPDIVYLAKRESNQTLRMFSAIGRRLPAYTTALGKALLAHVPDDQLVDHLPEPLRALTEQTITDPEALRIELRWVYEHGYSLDREENSEGVYCVAVALPAEDPPQDALSCSIPRMRFREAAVPEIVRALQKASEEIAARYQRRRHG